MDAWEQKRAALLATMQQIGWNETFLKMLLDEAYLFGRTEAQRKHA